MDNLSLTCSLSHRLYCPVMSLYHMCVQSTCCGWEWTISRSHAVCHIDCRPYCPVLSLVDPICRQWVVMSYISLTYAVCHMHCIVLCCRLMHGDVVICFSRYKAVDDSVLQRVIIGYRVFEENCVNNQCTQTPFRERGPLGMAQLFLVYIWVGYPSPTAGNKP